jgi:hypothetical protein
MSRSQLVSGLIFELGTSSTRSRLMITHNSQIMISLETSYGAKYEGPKAKSGGGDSTLRVPWSLVKSVRGRRGDGFR